MTQTNDALQKELRLVKGELQQSERDIHALCQHCYYYKHYYIHPFTKERSPLANDPECQS
jgi:hypothetical protein